jgi:hypothetical protein
MQEDKDLDIKNYNYPELLGIFNAKRVFKQSVINGIEEKLKTIKKSLTVDYYLFYFKAYRIICLIHELFKKDIIQDADNINHIEFYVNSIKQIKEFEYLDDSEVFEELRIGPMNNKTNSKTNVVSEPPVSLENILQNNLINSYPYPVAPTTLNTVKRVTQFKNICLNSCFRNNYYTTGSSDFQYTIPSEIKNVVSMRLASIELPNCWYLYSNINKSNSFRIEVTDVSGNVTSFTITVAEGNYDYDTLPLYLNNNFFYNSTTSHLYLQQLQFIMEDPTLKCTFQVINGNLYNLKFAFIFCENENHNVMNTIGWSCGFRLGRYNGITDYIMGEGMFDGLGDQYIFISINDYQNSTNSSNIICFDNSVMEEDILGKILITNGKLNIIFTESNVLVRTRHYTGPVNIRNIHVKLLNRFGEILNMNYMDFSFTLEMEILYENFGFKYANTVR